MGVFIVTFLLIASTFTIILFSVKISENNEEAKNKIENLNRLYECDRCGRYHRVYQRTVKLKFDDNYRKVVNGTLSFTGDGQLAETKDYLYFTDNDTACPHCYHIWTRVVEEEYEWSKFHNDCIALNPKTVKNYKDALSEADQTAYELRSIEKMEKMLNIKGENQDD